MKNQNQANAITELVFILDRSGSMHGLESDTIGGFNGVIDDQKKTDGTVYVSTVLFNHASSVLHDRVPLDKINPMTAAEYQVGGSTALLDAIGDAVHHIKTIHKYIRPEDVPAHTMFVIITDGYENASRRYNYEAIRRTVEAQKEAGWEFLFLGANIDAFEAAARVGISADRAANFNPDTIGTAEAFCAVSPQIKNLRQGARISPKWAASVEADHKNRKSTR